MKYKYEIYKTFQGGVGVKEIVHTTDSVLEAIFKMTFWNLYGEGLDGKQKYRVRELE